MALGESVRSDISHAWLQRYFCVGSFPFYCYNKHQENFFSTVGAQHQNTRLERSVLTIIYMARTFMVHSSLHCTDHGANDIYLWSFVVKDDVWLHNILPNYCSSITPLELLTRNRSDYHDLIWSYVWGVPFLYCTLNYKMIKRHQSGIGALA